MDGVLTLASDQIDAGDDVAPLVGSTDLDLTTEVVVQPEVVVGLEQHVAELRERDAVFALETDAHALASHHLIDGDVLADVAEELEQRDRLRPVAVVDEDTTLGVRQVDDAPELFLDRRHVGAQRLVVEQIPLLGPAARIAHHAGGPSGQRDRPVPGILEAPEHDQPDQVPDVQAVGRRVTSVVDPDRAVLYTSPQELSIGRIVDEAAGLEVGDQVHSDHDDAMPTPDDRDPFGADVVSSATTERSATS